MSPSVAHPAVKHDGTDGRAKATATGTLEARARCIPWFVPNAARTQRYRSSLEATGRSTVVIATASRAEELRHADIRPDLG